MEKKTYLIILVLFVHPALTFRFRDDLARVLHDNLVGFETAVAADAVAAVTRLDNLHTDTVPAALLGALLQVLKRAVLAMVLAEVAVCVIALVQHDAILTVLIAAVFGPANAPGREIPKMGRLFPIRSRIPDKTI
jgi:hypothetical protein